MNSQELLDALPTAAIRVLRARLTYAGTTRDRLNDAWDIRVDGAKVQVRIAVKERTDGGLTLTLSYRPRDLAHVIARVAVAGGWNVITSGRLEVGWNATDLDRPACDCLGLRWSSHIPNPRRRLESVPGALLQPNG